MLVSCVCLSVCLLMLYSSQFNSNLHQTSKAGRHRPGKELMDGTDEIIRIHDFLKDFSTLRDMAFCNNFLPIYLAKMDLDSRHGTNSHFPFNRPVNLDRVLDTTSCSTI